MQPLRIYLSAPIANNPDGYEAHFEALETWAKDFFEKHLNRPFEIINPLKLPHEHGRTRDEYLQDDLEALKTCHVIILGVGWETANDCLQERRLAGQLGLELLPESVVNAQKTAFTRCMDGRTECCGQMNNYFCRLIEKLNAA